MFQITKTFDFCYGHRVHVQQLNEKFSISNKCKCRALHGHNGIIEIALSSEKLDNFSMVTDFNNLNWFKKWLDDVLDHKFIMDINDPLLDTLFPSHWDLIKKQDISGAFVFDENSWETFFSSSSPEQKELYEGLVIVDFVPTSENLSAWLHRFVTERMKLLGISVAYIKFYETPKSSSTFHV